MPNLLQTINSPADLRAVPRHQLPALADELRSFVLNSVAKTGGHLSSNLGTVELTVALHYVFNTPHDRIVWDVGHQTYPHKILTGRRDQMGTLRQRHGLSGFPRRDESEYDAFGTAHRAEGTTYGIAQFAPIACAGPLLAAEIDAIGKALANPKRPLAAIVAGSKVSTKLTILKSLSQNVDQLIVGGGIANTFMLAAGLNIGKSLAEADLVDEAKAVIDAMKARGAEVPIPTDVVTAKTFAADAVATVKKATEVEDDDLILDIGPETAAKLAAQLKQAGTIVWNGPVGVFEFAAFENGTKVIAQAIAESSAFSIAGGGDTLAAIAKYGIEKQVGYISTGGGAFLEILEGKTLPAFEILAKRAAG